MTWQMSASTNRSPWNVPCIPIRGGVSIEQRDRARRNFHLQPLPYLRRGQVPSVAAQPGGSVQPLQGQRGRASRLYDLRRLPGREHRVRSGGDEEERCDGDSSCNRSRRRVSAVPPYRLFPAVHSGGLRASRRRRNASDPGEVLHDPHGPENMDSPSWQETISNVICDPETRLAYN